MVIQGEQSRIAIEVQEVGATTFDQGDVKFRVVIESHGFGGTGLAWVSATALRAFSVQLGRLESSRQGVATLESMSPGVLLIKVFSINSRGHMAVAGRLGHHIHAGEAGPYTHSVEFGFEFDPTSLPAIVEAIKLWTP